MGRNKDYTGLAAGRGSCGAVRREEAYIFLEDTINLLEIVMKISAKITLEPDAFLPGLVWTAEESWHNPDNDPAGNEHRMIFMANQIDNVTRCVCVYPSIIFFYMASGYKGFENIRDEQRFKDLLDRARKLVVTRPKDSPLKEADECCQGTLI